MGSSEGLRRAATGGDDRESGHAVKGGGVDRGVRARKLRVGKLRAGGEGAAVDVRHGLRDEDVGKRAAGEGFGLHGVQRGRENKVRIRSDRMIMDRRSFQWFITTSNIDGFPLLFGTAIIDIR